jgi:hypothetical protein
LDGLDTRRSGPGRTVGYCGGNRVADAVAGWYNDPEHTGQLRWWNGTSWTEHRAAAPPARVVVPPAIYPAPTPLQFDFPPPGTATHPLAPENPVGTPPERPRSRRRTWLVVAGIAVVVILIAALAVYFVPRQFAAPAASAPAISPPAVSTKLPDIFQPGMVGTFQVVTAGGERTTEAAAVADETTHYASEQMDSRCAPLAFGSPVDGNAQDAGDPIVYYSNFLSGSGGTSISGAVQVFASAASVDTYIGQRRTLAKSCLGGFPDGDGVDKVTIVTGTLPTGATFAWNQAVTTSARSYTVHSIEWRNGTMLARSWCYQLAGTSDSPDICGQWAQEVQAALKDSH